MGETMNHEVHDENGGGENGGIDFFEHVYLLVKIVKTVDLLRSSSLGVGSWGFWTSEQLRW